MRKNVGIRIMEIADIYYKYFMLTATVTGVLEIIAGIVIAIATGIFWIFLAGAVVGVLIIWGGAWVAEVSTIKMYGHGIIVDRMEHLKPEYFDDRAPKRPYTPAKPAQSFNQKPAQSSNQKPAHTRVTVDNQQEWKCPECLRVNQGFAQECMSCFTPRPKEK